MENKVRLLFVQIGGKPLGLFKEYYRASELTEDAWHDGIYYTGDVAWRDEDWLFLVCRSC